MALRILKRPAVLALLFTAVLAAGVYGASQVVLSGQTGAVVELGSTVLVSGTADVKWATQVCLMADRKTVDARRGDGTYSLKWETGNASIGNHELEVAAVSVTGSRKIIYRAQVMIVVGPPVKISLPGDTVELGKPQIISVQSAAGYSPTKARLCVDSVESKQELGITDGAIEWDADSLSGGDHTLRVATRDYDGRIAQSPTLTVKVPKRLIIKPPESVVITEDHPDIVVPVVIPKGVEVTRLKGWVDVEPPVETDSRVSELRLPALALQSGRHEIRVEMVDGTGTTYKQGPLPVSVDNQYAAALAAKATAEREAAEAAEKALQEAVELGAAEEKERLAKLQGQSDAKEQEKRTNDWIRSREAAYVEAARLSAISRSASRAKLANSGGKIGVAKCMSVTVVDGSLEFGNTVTITAKLAKGDGSVTVNASDVDSDFVSSMTNARKFVISHLKKLGRNVDLSKANFDLHYQRSGPKGGDSAGAAMATAMISVLLRVPIRNEVVITGAIREDGNVMPVGSIDLKAAAAFQDPSVLTVIVPRFRENVEEVLSLPPKLLTGHRLVAADDMGQVLRQALRGYDEGTLAKASGFFAQGLSNYAAGKTASAISYLERARELTPEDLTIPVWLGVVKKTQR